MFQLFAFSSKQNAFLGFYFKVQLRISKKFARKLNDFSVNVLHRQIYIILT